MASRLLLALALVLAGCATFTDAELAQIRQRNLRPELLAKLEHRHPLEPDDLIALKRAGVADEHAAKHLDDVGVNYVATREDAVRLRRAGVRPLVIDALLRACERFAAQESYRPYEDGWFYPDPWVAGFYSDYTIGFHRHGHGHRRH